MGYPQKIIGHTQFKKSFAPGGFSNAHFVCAKKNSRFVGHVVQTPEWSFHANRVGKTPYARRQIPIQHSFQRLNTIMVFCQMRHGYVIEHDFKLLLFMLVAWNRGGS